MTDEEIYYLLTLPKRVTNAGARWLESRGSRKKTYEVSSIDGQAHFRLFVRQNTRMETNFSCGLHYLRRGQEDLCLTRYNGNDHEHSNALDPAVVVGREYHVHRATERYMRAGRKPESFAEKTSRYKDLSGALQALCEDCKIEGITTTQLCLDL